MVEGHVEAALFEQRALLAEARASAEARVRAEARDNQDLRARLLRLAAVNDQVPTSPPVLQPASEVRQISRQSVAEGFNFVQSECSGKHSECSGIT